MAVHFLQITLALSLAFGIQRNAPFAEIMNTKILEYKEVGWLEDLWQKWLKEGISCPGKDVSTVLTLIICYQFRFYYFYRNADNSILGF